MPSMMWRWVSTRTRSRRNCIYALSAHRQPGSSVPPRVRPRRRPPTVVRPARGGRSGARRCSTPTRTSAPTIPTASSRRRSSSSRRSRSSTARALVFPMHEPDGYAAANDAVMEAVAASDGRLRSLCRVQPRDPGAVAEAQALPRGRRERHQAAPAGGGVHALRAVGARARRGRARAPRGGADPRRPRHPGARAGHGAALGRVPRRPADPRPLRDLGPGVAVARAPRPPEPVHRHGVVGARRRARDVRAVPARQHRVGERLALRAPARRRDADAAARAAGGAHASTSCAA